MNTAAGFTVQTDPETTAADQPRTARADTGIRPYRWSDSTRVLLLYRYVSWFLTSLFFLTAGPRTPEPSQFALVIVLLAAGRLVARLYAHNRDHPLRLAMLITTETLAIALLLLPTGGLDSPFTWYALNPILAAAVLRPGFYCWSVLALFLAAASAGSALWHHGALAHLLTVWQEHAWLLLVFLLVTTAAQLFTLLINKLTETNDKLSAAHQAAERALAHTTALYQVLETFTSGENPRRLADLLADFGQKLTASPAVLCCLADPKRDAVPVWSISNPADTLSKMKWLIAIDKGWQHIQDGNIEPFTLPIPGEVGRTEARLVCVPIRSHGECFGFLGCLATTAYELDANGRRALGFLSEIGAVVLERCKTDALFSRLRVAEEQNRIANEIHDGVSQRLFSIVFALHALSGRQGDVQEPDIQHQLELIKRTANQAARELRASIYRLSPRKRGEQVFVAGVSSYLDGLAQLNAVRTDLQAEGSEDALSPALKSALYRIIREATANAIRHASCTSIRVLLKMAPGNVVMEISDDGRGFDPKQLAESGLGLANMRNLVQSFRGRFAIETAPGRGTKISCVIPGDEKPKLARTPGTGGTNAESGCG